MHRLGSTQGMRRARCLGLAAPAGDRERLGDVFDLTCAHDLEGIIAKRLADPYHTHVRWLRIKNPSYSQSEGSGDLFNAPRLRPWKREEPYRFRAGAGAIRPEPGRR